ncbi:MAG TPA: TM0106 family RecB-like putative nuclease [Candidatus Limnocylindrales bacterium]|nr:TM0106 family RecB-like putative nuclease [Candidatus Limnocylindrales bacterium]
MQLIDGRPVCSATDLVGYLACEHLTALERAALAGLTARPHRDDPELDVLRRRGEKHEWRYLAQLEDEGRTVVRIERDDDAERGDRIRRQADETVAAMRAGADVIYQATFFDGQWLGYADFLLRVEATGADDASVWGPWHYEVADTKLAHHAKAGAVLQICSYIDQLQRLQGVTPREMRVVLGGSAGEVARLRVDDFMAYYRAAKRRFEEAVFGTDEAPAPPPTFPPASTYPEPVEHCGVCRWSMECEARRRADDHLSLVAGITVHQRKALGGRGIETLTALAGSPIPFDPPLDGASASSTERVREQARIQLEGRGRTPPLHELLLPEPDEPVDPERGLATLPEPDAGDLFFDIEGDPYAFDDGIDYLFGVLDTDQAFTAFWSYDPARPAEINLAGEKAAFEAFIDFVRERRRRHPGMHVYHYAPYEPTALKRLMGRHATREAEVDELLRGGVLVDLYRAVRQGVRASVESYSIKKLEPIYGFTREIDLRDAGSSIVAFEEWLELGEGDQPTSDILQRIENYNRDDVVSTLRLRGWLEGLRSELANLTGKPVPRPAERVQEAPDALTQAAAEVQAVADRLTADPGQEDNDMQHARWLLAQLLSWHRRESKATFWDFFRRVGLTPGELVEEDSAIGQLELVSVGEPYLPTPRSRRHRRSALYRFPPQEHRDVGGRSDLFDPGLAQEHAGESPWETWKLDATLGEIDDQRNTLELIWMADGELRHPQAIVALNRIPEKPLPQALLRLGTGVADNGIGADGPWRAARDLLLRRPPRCGQDPGATLRLAGEDDLDAACRLVTRLDRGTLAIQGPPGSGKTYTAAEMVVRCLAAGQRVGISATSHKVIENLLGKVFQAADRSGVDVRAVQKPGDDGSSVTDPRLTLHAENNRVREALAGGECNVGAGTPWLWGREDFEGIVDVLFVDEAGQISLANVLAMGGATSSLVLMGDPQQLDQPLQGSHPPGADASALGHLLGTDPTMPSHRGLFLEHTWRMHPALTAFTSKAFYEERLTSRPNLVNQSLSGPDPIGGVGPRLLSVEHAGSDNISPEEARQVAALAMTLVSGGATWIAADGEECPIGWKDILIVAPYNAQVGEIRRHLPAEARVGTVDKFQGQEAPISVYSMTSSSAEDAPRGMSFLYSRNRLNVATSRARCVAVVVASSELLRVRASSIAEMRLANALCLYVEMAAAT